MDHFRAIEISAAGMAAQKTRIEAAALNLANIGVSSAPGTQAYRPVKAVIHSVPASFPTLLRGGGQPLMIARADIVAQSSTSSRLAYEPGHPHADSTGMVAYAAIDHTGEMMTVITAMRAYEANLAALQVSKALTAKALEIGGQ